MSRHRVAFLATTTALSLALLGPTLMARQPTAAGPGGSGVLGADLLGLVTNPPVQAELKLTGEQKAQIKALGERDEEQRLRWFERMGLWRPDGAGNRGASESRGGQAARAGAGGQPGGNSNGTGGRRGPDDPRDAGPQEPFETMLESRLKIQQSTERSIARILTRTQYARARQIQLQVEGPDALLRPEIQERLFLDEDQIAQVRELMLERRRALRETRDARGALRRAALDRDPSLGRLNDPASREARNQALRKFDEDPENQKRMSAFRAQDGRIAEQFAAALHAEVLTRRQSQAYKKMLGAPFDPARPLGGPDGSRGVGESDGSRGGPSVAKSPVAGDGDGATAARSEKEASGQPSSPAAAKPRRGSLLEQRGLGTSDDRR